MSNALLRIACPMGPRPVFFFFFFNDTATTEIYTLSLHDALPILVPSGDHAGFASTAVLFVSCVTPLPSAFMTQISSSNPPSRWQSNAIRLPACDHAANVSILGSFVSWVIPLLFFYDTSTTEIYTLSLHDALPHRGWQHL